MTGWIKCGLSKEVPIFVLGTTCLYSLITSQISLNQDLQMFYQLSTQFIHTEPLPMPILCADLAKSLQILLLVLQFLVSVTVVIME